jgi:hypothetical protein
VANPQAVMAHHQLIRNPSVQQHLTQGDMDFISETEDDVVTTMNNNASSANIRDQNQFYQP